MRELEVARFRSDGVDLALDLLQEEVDAFAYGLLGVEQVAQRPEVALQANDLLGHVAALGEKCRLLQDAPLVELAVDELAHSFLDATARIVPAGFGPFGHSRRELVQRTDARPHVVGQMFALAQPRGVELHKRATQRAHQNRALALRHRGCLAGAVQVRDALEKRQIHLARQPQPALQPAPLVDVGAREIFVDLDTRSIVARDGSPDVDLHAASADTLLNELAYFTLPGGVFLRQRQLEIEEALVDALDLDRDGAARAGAEPHGSGPESGHALHACLFTPSSASNSAAEAVAVPSLPTTTPAARLA